MRLAAVLAAVAATGAFVPSAPAQNPRVRVMPGAPPMAMRLAGPPRAVIGITTSSSASSRDTLGVFVSEVRSGSPAEKSGIEEGNRIASINGVSLRLSAADVGEPEMAGIMTRRLTRELDKLKPGDEVDLRVYAGGQFKNVKVKTVAPDDLYEAAVRPSMSERATLGLRLASTGSARDTLGAFVIGVVDDGPAAKAGIEEGSRIASINGVDVRGRRSGDEDDVFMRTLGVSRLEREVSKLKPGDDANLRVYYNGQYRNITVKTARASDLPRSGRSITIMGGDNMMLPSTARIDIDGARIGEEMRAALERARVATGGALIGAGRTLGRFGNRVDW
ncbi:MAG TPA: PDZ domain-containing protein [Gemmatimonadaceae bacterium]|nr:PDZ domain-containing protein [Gemmatimonadaceae bacterium]